MRIEFYLKCPHAEFGNHFYVRDKLGQFYKYCEECKKYLHPFSLKYANFI